MDTIKSLIIPMLVFFGVAGLLVYFIGSNGRAYREGKITLEQYCDSYKTETQIPAVCYQYFGVHPTGTHTVPMGKASVVEMNYAPN